MAPRRLVGDARISAEARILPSSERQGICFPPILRPHLAQQRRQFPSPGNRFRAGACGSRECRGHGDDSPCAGAPAQQQTQPSLYVDSRTRLIPLAGEKGLGQHDEHHQRCYDQIRGHCERLNRAANSAGSRHPTTCANRIRFTQKRIFILRNPPAALLANIAGHALSVFLGNRCD